MASRREFMKGVTLATTACGLGCGGGSSPTGPLTPPGPTPQTLRTALMAVGETVAVFSGDAMLAVTRLSATSVVAVTRVCTHMGCTVLLPETPGSTLNCPCHGSRFTTSGQVVNGPANRPLPSYRATIDGSQVVITVD